MHHLNIFSLDRLFFLIRQGGKDERAFSEPIQQRAYYVKSLQSLIMSVSLEGSYVQGHGSLKGLKSEGLIDL